VTDQSGNVQTSVYDAHGSLTSQVTVTASGVSEKIVVNGQLTQQDDYFNDLTSVIHTINADKTQSAMAYDATGTAVSNTLFDVNGNKTTEYIFRADGSTSQQYDFKLDGSIVQHDLNLDGSQSSTLFGPNGMISEYAAYDASGFKTQDLFFTNGTETTRYDYVQGGNTTKYDFTWTARRTSRCSARTAR